MLEYERITISMALGVSFNKPSERTDATDYEMFDRMVLLKTGYQLAKQYGERQYAVQCLKQYRRFNKYFNKRGI